MVVEATYVLCTSYRFIDEKEARHRDKVKIINSS
jgi:hypothetical protein